MAWARSASDPSGQARALWQLAWIAQRRGDVDRATALLQHSLEVCPASDTNNRLSAEVMLLEHEALTQPGPIPDERLDRLKALADRTGYLTQQAYIRWFEGLALARHGDFAAAEAALQEHVALMRREATITVVSGQLTLASLYRVWGRTDRALAELQSLTGSIGVPDVTAMAWCELAAVRAQIGDLPGAHAALDRARGAVRDLGSPRVGQLFEVAEATVELARSSAEGEGAALEERARRRFVALQSQPMHTHLVLPMRALAAALGGD